MVSKLNDPEHGKRHSSTGTSMRIGLDELSSNLCQQQLLIESIKTIKNMIDGLNLQKFEIRAKYESNWTRTGPNSFSARF